jgi:hypothetical protein
VALGEQIDRHLLIRFQINITASQITGIMIDQSRIPNPLGSLVEGFSSCTINPPAEDQVISMDVSFDVTNQFSGISSGFGITVNPLVTFKMIGLTTTQVVTDFFSTNAAIILNAHSERGVLGQCEWEFCFSWFLAAL